MLEYKLRCILIDDELPALLLLEDHVRRTELLELANSFRNPIHALDWLKNNQVDLVICDIQMPQLNGIELIKQLPTGLATIICSAYPQYAIEGFEQEVQDYLMKPVSLERFQKAIHRCRNHILSARSPVDSSLSKNYILVRSERKQIRVLISDILYLQGLRDYVAIHLKDKKILTLQSMRSLEQELPLSSFTRIHKSYIVNLSSIELLKNNRIVINETELPVSETFKKQLQKKLQES